MRIWTCGPMHGEHLGLAACMQVLHKAPIREAKQVEHIVNERRAQAASRHPLCVRLHAAFQDTHCLYLLQEFVPGACVPSSLLPCTRKRGQRMQRRWSAKSVCAFRNCCVFFSRLFALHV